MRVKGREVYRCGVETPNLLTSTTLFPKPHLQSPQRYRKTTVPNNNQYPTTESNNQLCTKDNTDSHAFDFCEIFYNAPHKNNTEYANQKKIISFIYARFNILSINSYHHCFVPFLYFQLACAHHHLYLLHHLHQF